MRKRGTNLEDVIPFFSFGVLFVVFTAATGGRMVTPYNMMAIAHQTVILIIGGLGAIFVIAQGSVDLSIGTTMALSATLAAMLSQRVGNGVVMLPTVVVVGAAVGFLNGIIVSKCKVPSFMATLAMLIGVRGVVNYLLSKGLHFAPAGILALNAFTIKLPLLAVLIAVITYLFEYTKVGWHCKAIGENETAAGFVGIPVARTKISAFVISGVMAGVAGLFTMAKLGGTSTSMGNGFEIQVIMATFLGGVMVTGGTNARIYKLLVGAFTITVIINGLVLCGLSSSESSEAVQGILLMVILFITIRYRENRATSRGGLTDAEKAPARTL